MLSAQQIAQRRANLLALLQSVEEDLKSPLLKPKIRAGSKAFCTSISFAIQELEVVLGLRNSTTLDDYVNGLF